MEGVVDVEELWNCESRGDHSGIERLHTPPLPRTDPLLLRRYNQDDTSNKGFT